MIRFIHYHFSPLFCLFLALHAAVGQPGVVRATVRVDSTRVENHVSPRMYAAFVEMMAEDVKRGLTAEMLLDRSFEEPADYLGLPAHWQLEPDERNDNVAAIQFKQTTDEAYPRMDAATNALNHALQLTLAPGDITDDRRGLSQGRLSLRAGQRYAGYFWAKRATSNGYAGSVRLLLEQDVTDGQVYAQQAIPSLQAGGWQRYDFSLVPSSVDRFAKLTLLFDGHGVLFLDQLSLMPADAQTQVRPDVEAMVKSLQPSFLRWPGGNVAQDYHWQWGIGPRDLRPVWVNKAWSNAPEPDDFGTDEYLAFCARTGIQPSITVNVDGAGATSAEAAAWVEYVNGPVTSKYGAMRAGNGHPAPYAVKQWELGNEIFGGWVRGHVTAQAYAQRAVQYARAMRAVDPTLQLVAVGEGVFDGSDAWNSTVARIAGNDIQFLAVHDYTSVAQNAKEPNPRDAMMARAGEFEANYRHMADLLHGSSGNPNLRLIVNEWNLFYDAATIQSMEGAVYASRMMNGFERDGDIVEANAISDLLNGWVGGILQASRDRICATPQYYAVKMYREHLGVDRLAAVTTSPLLPSGLSAVDALATRSADGRAIYIKLSNADPHHSILTSVEADGVLGPSSAQVQLLAAATPASHNSLEHPLQVHPVLKTIPCARTCTVQLPRDSVAVITLQVHVAP